MPVPCHVAGLVVICPVCVFSIGYPQPTVAWHKNGQELSPRDGSVIISWELNHARLELRNVAVKDAGRYTCKAVNSVGSASSTADVVVKSKTVP
jgi:myosin-light-chain kinase